MHNSNSTDTNLILKKKKIEKKIKFQLERNLFLKVIAIEKKKICFFIVLTEILSRILNKLSTLTNAFTRAFFTRIVANMVVEKQAMRNMVRSQLASDKTKKANTDVYVLRQLDKIPKMPAAIVFFESTNYETINYDDLEQRNKMRQLTTRQKSRAG